MSRLTQAIALIDEVGFACRGLGGPMARVFTLLSLPGWAMLLALGFLGPREALWSMGALAAPYAEGGPALTLSLLLGVFPPLGLLALTAVALTSAGALFGWHSLHGRVPTPRGILLTLWAHRWGLLTLTAAELVGYGVCLFLFLSIFLPLYKGAPGGLPSLALGYGWPFLLLLITAPLSFLLFLIPPALVIEGGGALGALRRGSGLLGANLRPVAWGWGLTQLAGGVLGVNLLGLLVGQLPSGPRATLTALGDPSLAAGVVALGVGLVISPLSGLLRAGIYRSLTPEEPKAGGGGISLRGAS